MSVSTDVQPPCEVLPGLWQSGLPEEWPALAGRYDVVVDLADPGPGPSVEDLRDMDYLKAPLVDGDRLPDEALLASLATLVADQVRAGRRVLVHCTYGKNRSGLVVALAVRELLGCNGTRALEVVRGVRDRAVNNRAFAAWVSALPAPTTSPAGRR